MNMNKRKNILGKDMTGNDMTDKGSNISKYKLYNYYYNPLNCNKIELCDNHIYFNSLIHKDAIDYLIKFIIIIINNYKLINFDNDFKIYIHINSKGGYLSELLNFINFKKSRESEFELISIIENECYDSGFILASLCDYRIVNKCAKIYMSKYDANNSGQHWIYWNYWNYFKQCEIEDASVFQILLYNMLCNNIRSKITYEKVAKILQNNSCWDAKKYKKHGFADEIV